MGKLTELLQGAFGLGTFAFFILIGLGDLYWLWMAIQFGSFWMFVVGLFPPLVPLTGPIGAWSLLVGTPDWLANMFG